MTTSNDLVVLARRDVAELIEHCRKIVVKDQDLADSLETSESMIEASRYLEVYYKIDKYPYHEIIKMAILEKVIGLDRAEDTVLAADVRTSIEAMTDITNQQRAEALMILDRLTMPSGGITASIVDNDIDAIREYYMNQYTDKNPYYYDLQVNNAIPPWKSRLAEDFEILKEPNTSGSSLLSSFSSTYSKIRRYFMTVMYTKAYSKDMVGKTASGEPINYYKAYCRLMVCTMTIVELMNNKLEFPLDIGYIDEYSVDQLLFSFGFTEFKKFPMYYKKSIALKINTLIRHRGTDNVFVDILKIFDFDGINIIKFYLTKYRSGNETKQLDDIEIEPRFLGHSVKTEGLQQAMKNGTYREYSFDAMTQDDQYWIATKDEVSAEEFDFLPSKYFSIEGDFRMWRDVMNLAYFVSLIRKLKKDHAFRTHLSLHASEISQNELFIDELILAAQILLIDFYNVEDLIQFEHESIQKIYSFDDKDDSSLNIDVFGTDALIPNSYVNENYVLERVDSYDSIQDKELEKIFIKDLKVLDNFLAYQDKTSSDGDQLMTYAQYKKYKTLYQTKFLADYNLSEYHGFSTYTEYLQFNGNPDLYKYVAEAKESTDQDLKHAKITYLLSALKEYSYFLDISFNRMVSDLIVEYITTTINVFKSYTVSMKDFKILYKWNEKNFFEMYDSDNKHGYFVWDWKVRFKDFKNKIHPGLGTVTNNSYTQSPPRDMNLADSQRFHDWFYLSDRMTVFRDRETFHGWFFKKDKVKYFDESVFHGFFKSSGVMAFGDSLTNKHVYGYTLRNRRMHYADRIDYDTAPGVDYWYLDKNMRFYREFVITWSKYRLTDLLAFGDSLGNRTSIHLSDSMIRFMETQRKSAGFFKIDSRKYREFVLTEAQWTKADVSTLNDLTGFSVVIPSGISDSAMLLDRFGDEQVRWKDKDANLYLVDKYYLYMKRVELPMIDRHMINDWAYLSTNKYTLHDQRKFLTDRIFPGKASAVLFNRAAFAPDRLGLYESNWFKDQYTLVDQTSWKVSQTSKLDRRNFADRGVISSQRILAIRNDKFKFMDGEKVFVDALIIDIVSAQDLSDFKASATDSDHFVIMDRFEIVVHE